jgi:hypothetical protein
MRAEFYTALVGAIRATTGIELQEWRLVSPKARVRFDDEGEQYVVQPDALITLRQDRIRMTMALEFDRATMTNKRFGQKMLAYYLLAEKGLHYRLGPFKNFRVMTVTTTTKRMENLMRATRETLRGHKKLRKGEKLTREEAQQGLGLFWFSHQSRIDLDKPLSIFHPIWWRLKDYSHDLQACPTRSLLARQLS